MPISSLSATYLFSCCRVHGAPLRLRLMIRCCGLTLGVWVCYNLPRVLPVTASSTMMITVIMPTAVAGILHITCIVLFLGTCYRSSISRLSTRSCTTISYICRPCILSRVTVVYVSHGGPWRRVYKYFCLLLVQFQTCTIVCVHSAVVVDLNHCIVMHSSVRPLLPRSVLQSSYM